MFDEFNYYSEMKEAIYDYFEFEYSKEQVQDLFKTDFGRQYDYLLYSDAITGAGSGSYYCNSYEAMEMIKHNYDLLEECVENGTTTYEGLGRMICQGDFEGMDVMIRQNLLHFVMWEIIEEAGMKA